MDREHFVFKPGLKDDGKPIIDFRTIPLRSILKLKLLPPLPDCFSVDENLGGLVDNNMFGNDQYGDCVKAAMAHQTLRFEKFEQGVLIPISRDEVIAEYLRETGGADNGLFLTYAMKDWRNHGLIFNGKTYKIYGYAGVDKADHIQVKYTIYLLRGIIFGMQVYSTDVDQFRKNERWHLTGSNGTFEGGHGVYGYAYKTLHHNCPNCASGYEEDGLTCNTWGEEQPMDWEFWDARVNQVFAIIDNKNTVDSSLDIATMEKQLKEITGEDVSTGGCLCPTLSRILNVFHK